MPTLWRNPDTFALLSAEMDRMLGDITRPTTRLGAAPAADVLETEADFRVVLDLPGHDPKALQIGLEDDTLTIQGERTPPAREGQTVHRSERRFGAFQRSFTLPRTVDGAKVEAHYDAGVLTIVLPKREEARPRSISVQVK